jgi:phage shock protein PspC (stress-responsive transcriptional regulator)
MAGKEKPKKTQADYEEIGKMVASIYETGYPSTKRTLRMSLFKGVLAGLGGVLGATVGVALLLWVLSLFDSVPLVGHFVQTLTYTIESNL